MSYSPGDEITLEGGMAKTGEMAELVRWKNGRGISLRTNEPYESLPCVRRQTRNESLDDGVARNLAIAGGLKNCFIPFKTPRSSTNRRARRRPVDEWIKHQQTIKHLYIDQDKTLEEVVEIMQEDHGFHATPRQYTQKFKSWHLQKNVRQIAKRKSRYRSSIYRSAPIAREGFPNLDAVESRRMQATGSPGREQVDYRPAVSQTHTAWSPDHRSPNPISDRKQVAQYSNRDGGSNVPLEPDGANKSSAIVTDDGHELLENVAGLLSMQGNSMEATSNTSIALTSTSGKQQLAGATHGPQAILSAFAEQSSSKIQKMKEKLEERNILTFYIWQLWHSGMTSRFGAICEAFESNQSHGIDITHLSNHTQLALAKWLNCYPYGMATKAQPHGHLPPFCLPDGSGLTWKTYAERGYAIASQKTQMAPAKAQAQIELAQRMLAASMMMAPEGSRYLRRCLEVTLTFFELILQQQYDELKLPCQRLAKHFRLPESEERKITGSTKQANGAAVLAMICYKQIMLQGLHTSHAFNDLNDLSARGLRSSIERAFVWAARLMLYYASPDIGKGLLPSILCARALDGFKRVWKTINSHPHQATEESTYITLREFPSDVWRDSNFANLWAEWVCCDGEFFLHDPRGSE